MPSVDRFEGIPVAVERTFDELGITRLGGSVQVHLPVIDASDGKVPGLQLDAISDD
jgi:hypothetical protein